MKKNLKKAELHLAEKSLQLNPIDLAEYLSLMKKAGICYGGACLGVVIFWGGVLVSSVFYLPRIPFLLSAIPTVLLAVISKKLEDRAEKILRDKTK